MLPTPLALEAAFAQTLADQRLTGSERQALMALLEPLRADAAKLAVVRQRIFEMARAKLADAPTKAVLDWLEAVNKLLLPLPVPTTAPPVEAAFSPGGDCLALLGRLFRQCRATCDVCVFTITDDRITQHILDAHRRGVRLRILTDNEKAADLGSDIERLEQAGIPVRIDCTPAHMHHKFALFDGVRVLTGSYNWTRSAAEHNHENVVVVEHAGLVERFQTAFDGLWTALG